MGEGRSCEGAETPRYLLEWDSRGGPQDPLTSGEIERLVGENGVPNRQVTPPTIIGALAWMHGFRDAIEGPILQVPGSSVRLDAQVDTLWAGVNIKFGGSK